MKRLTAIIVMMAMCVAIVAQIHHHNASGSVCPIIADILSADDCDCGGCHDHDHSTGGACDVCHLSFEALADNYSSEHLIGVNLLSSGGFDVVCKELILPEVPQEVTLVLLPPNADSPSPGVVDVAKRRGPPAMIG